MIDIKPNEDGIGSNYTESYNGLGDGGYICEICLKPIISIYLDDSKKYKDLPHNCLKGQAMADYVLLSRICKNIEKKYGISGLYSNPLYCGYAMDVAKSYHKIKSKK